MKELIAPALLIMATLSFTGQAQPANRVEQKIRQVNADEVAALLRNDVKTLDGLWSQDFVVTNPFNKFLKKQQVIDLAKTGMLSFSSYDRNIEYVRIYGDTAVVAGYERVVWADKMPNAGKTSQLRFTAVWMKQEERWLQVARHANIFEPQ
jgi:ketosteroid isomerase-like protein